VHGFAQLRESVRDPLVDAYDLPMTLGRRDALAKLGIATLAAAVLIGAAMLLPDHGALGVLGSVLGFVGVAAAFGVPAAIWRVVSPDRAARWDADPKGSPVPLVAPILWWVGTGTMAWILTQLEPPTTTGDYAGMVFLWCVVAGAAAFAVAFTVMYIRGRRTSEQ